VGSGLQYVGARMPTFQMPDRATRRRSAELAEITTALRAARCAARLASLRTNEFVVRELLLRVIDELNRAERGVASFVSTSLRDDLA